MSKVEGTKTRALREASSLLQTYGYDGFSFQNIADAIGIRKPSLYVHYSSKEDLGQHLVTDFIERFSAWTQTVDSLEPLVKISALFELFQSFPLSNKQVCPLSALTASYNSLPETMHEAIEAACYFQADWIKRVIEEGQLAKSIRTDLSSDALAGLIHASGLGAQLIARGVTNPEGISALKETVLQLLRSS